MFLIPFFGFMFHLNGLIIVIVICKKMLLPVCLFVFLPDVKAKPCFPLFGRKLCFSLEEIINQGWRQKKIFRPKKVLLHSEKYTFRFPTLILYIFVWHPPDHHSSIKIYSSILWRPGLAFTMCKEPYFS